MGIGNWRQGRQGRQGRFYLNPPYPMPHSPCPMPHSPFPMPHSLIYVC
ncbi:hypothetical protein [Nostoc sp. CMAA1605]|nr:hypothetical protein [Nostoc sp. CMAA1605]